jgi:hypothetical protein
MVEFLIDRDAQRLKGARGRVDTSMDLTWHTSVDEGGQLLSRRDGIGSSRGHDLFCDPSAKALLAILINNVSQFAFLRSRKQLSNRDPFILTKSHVEVATYTKRKPPIAIF